jgi:hypothetical protein
MLVDLGHTERQNRGLRAHPVSAPFNGSNAAAQPL